jgi:hypothetical protein
MQAFWGLHVTTAADLRAFEFNDNDIIQFLVADLMMLIIPIDSCLQI